LSLAIALLIHNKQKNYAGGTATIVEKTHPNKKATMKAITIHKPNPEIGIHRGTLKLLHHQEALMPNPLNRYLSTHHCPLTGQDFT